MNYTFGNQSDSLSIMLMFLGVYPRFRCIADVMITSSIFICLCLELRKVVASSSFSMLSNKVWHHIHIAVSDVAWSSTKTTG